MAQCRTLSYSFPCIYIFSLENITLECPLIFSFIQKRENKLCSGNCYSLKARKSIFIVFNKLFDPWYVGWHNIAEFEASIKFKKINLDCQNWLNKNKTISMSSDNQNKTDCSWLITSNFGSYIILNFKFIEVNSKPRVK